MARSMKYRQLKAFTLVVETGSFVAAANDLAITQPSFSALIKALEEDVGVELFDRTTRRCVPTEAGRVFYEQVKTALDHLECAYRNIKDIGLGVAGRLTLSALPSLAAGVVTEALGLYKQQYPAVQIELIEQKNEPILEAVRTGSVDIGVGGIVSEYDDLDFEQLWMDSLMFVVPETHVMSGADADWACAEKYPLIMMDAGPVEHALRHNTFKVKPALTVQHAATALSMVRRGLGITILPSSIGSDLSLSGLKCVPIQGEWTRRRLGIITRKGVRLRATGQQFADLLRSLVSPA